ELLLAKGQNNEAIALAKENNIICEGAAFIAWDEQERVSVSRLEVYQPSVEPDMLAQAACGSGHLLSRIVAGRCSLMASVADSTLYDHAFEASGAGPIMAVREQAVEHLFQDVGANFAAWRTTLERHPLL